MANSMNNENEITYDPKKLINMVKRIYEAEKRNTRTENKSDKAMKDLIEQIIEEEANKCY